MDTRTDDFIATRTSVYQLRPGHEVPTDPTPWPMRQAEWDAMRREAQRGGFRDAETVTANRVGKRRKK